MFGNQWCMGGMGQYPSMGYVHGPGIFQQPCLFPGAFPNPNPFGYNQGHCLGLSDIKFMEKKNFPYDTQKLLDDMDSTAIGDVLEHRRMQEEMRDNYGYYSDKKAWKKNCEIIHKYKTSKYDKK